MVTEIQSFDKRELPALEEFDGLLLRFTELLRQRWHDLKEVKGGEGIKRWIRNVNEMIEELQEGIKEENLEETVKKFDEIQEKRGEPTLKGIVKEIEETVEKMRSIREVDLFLRKQHVATELQEIWNKLGNIRQETNKYWEKLIDTIVEVSGCKNFQEYIDKTLQGHVKELKEERLSSMLERKLEENKRAKETEKSLEERKNKIKV